MLITWTGIRLDVFRLRNVLHFVRWSVKLYLLGFNV